MRRTENLNRQPAGAFGGTLPTGQELSRRIVVMVIMALIVCLRPGTHATAGQLNALAVINEFDRMASMPLGPGFDPMNVQVTGRGEVLHTRFLNVGNTHAEIEILDRASLTTAAGDHPLFDGIASVTICGLPTEPVILETTDAITIDAAGLQLRVQGARWENSGQVVTISIGAATPDSC